MQMISSYWGKRKIYLNDKSRRYKKISYHGYSEREGGKFSPVINGINGPTHGRTHIGCLRTALVWNFALLSSFKKITENSLFVFKPNIQIFFAPNHQKRRENLIFWTMHTSNVFIIFITIDRILQKFIVLHFCYKISIKHDLYNVHTSQVWSLFLKLHRIRASIAELARMKSTLS